MMYEADNDYPWLEAALVRLVLRLDEHAACIVQLMAEPNRGQLGHDWCSNAKCEACIAFAERMEIVRPKGK